ncbi:MAG: cation:proton antiporter [Caldilineaceae bacterium]|nr:cation:proton antiporter [Caldilineaceae bacterium]
MEHNLLLLLSGIVVLGILCQWAAWWLKVPAILPLLASGFLVGPVFHLVDPHELLGDLFFPVVSLLVAVILFEGALTLNFSDVRAVASTVRNLVTIGALITWFGGAAAAHYLLDMEWLLAILFGALIVVTGPTVIAPLLRNVRPNPRIYSVLMWEGILIDPVGASLAVLVFDFIVAEGGAGHGVNPALAFLEIVLVGLALGLIGGYITTQLLKRYLIPDNLQDLVVLALVAGLFALSDTVEAESGLLTVTVMGVYLANSNVHQLREILHFKERLSTLFISGLFILLAASIQLETLALLDWRSLVLLAIVIFVLRPLNIQASALGSTLTGKERLFLSWVAPRGIVAAAITALFAFRLQELGYTEAKILEPLVFLVIVGTVVLQGSTAKWFARRLGVAEAEPQGFLLVGANPFGRLLAKAIKEEGFVVRLVDTDFEHVRLARMEGLDAYHGNILSEYTEEHLSLSGIGRLLALTSNDEANALACRHFKEEFGSAGIYQIVPRSLGQNDRNRAPGLRSLGRLLFCQAASYERLLDDTRQGAVIRRTKITPEFSYETLKMQCGDGFVPLMAVQDKLVNIAIMDGDFAPQSGWKVLSLTVENEEMEMAVKKSEGLTPAGV